MGKTDASRAKAMFVCFWKLRLANKPARLLLVVSCAKTLRIVFFQCGCCFSSCVRIEILIEMASKGESSNAGPKDVEGYIHDVSAIKTPSSGHRYFDFMVQEHVDSKRVVCFSPDKRESIKEKETSKAAVRILNVSPQKRKFQPNTIEYKMGGRSKVVTTKNIPFAWVESVVKKPKRVSIGDIVSSGGSSNV